MQTVAPPQISPHHITAFFAAMRAWLLEVMTPFLIGIGDRNGHGREIRAWLDADIRDALFETRQLLFAMAVARMAPRRHGARPRGGARPATSAPGFRPRAAPSRRWLRLTTRAFRTPARGMRGRLALLRDLVAAPERHIARIALCLKRLMHSRKGARLLCVAPPASRCAPVAAPCAPAGADTS